MAVTPGPRVAQIHTGDEISLQGQVSITLSYLIKAHKSKHGDTGQFITIWCILLLVAVHLLLCPVYIFNFLITVCIEEHTGRLGVPTILNLTSTHSLTFTLVVLPQSSWPPAPLVEASTAAIASLPTGVVLALASEPEHEGKACLITERGDCRYGIKLRAVLFPWHPESETLFAWLDLMSYFVGDWFSFIPD